MLQVSGQEDDTTSSHFATGQPHHDKDRVDCKLASIGSHLAGGRGVNMQNSSIHLVVTDVEKVPWLDGAGLCLNKNFISRGKYFPNSSNLVALPDSSCTIHVLSHFLDFYVELEHDLAQLDVAGEKGVNLLLLQLTKLVFPLGETDVQILFFWWTSDAEARAGLTLASHTLLIPGQWLQGVETVRGGAKRLRGNEPAGGEGVREKALLQEAAENVTEVCMQNTSISAKISF